MNWLVFADLNSATAALASINTALGYPALGINAATGQISRARTHTWAIPYHCLDGMYRFVTPPDSALVGLSVSSQSLDLSWFPEPT